MGPHQALATTVREGDPDSGASGARGGLTVQMEKEAQPSRQLAELRSEPRLPASQSGKLSPRSHAIPSVKCHNVFQSQVH